MKERGAKGGKPTGIKSFQGRMSQSIRRKAAGSELEVHPDHWLVDLLERPNRIQYRWQFTYSFIANLCLTGWSYIVGGKNEEGELEFYSLPTSWVQPDHTNGAFEEFRIINPKNPEAGLNSKPLSREFVAFAHLPNPSDPLSALAPASAQSRAIKIDDSIQSSQTVFFENAVFPSAIVTIGKNPHPDVSGGVRPRLTAEQRRQVYGAIRKVMSGVANYGNPAIIDGMIESIEKLSADQNEIGWEKSEKTIRTRILSAFGVHPFILGEEMVGSYAQAFIVQDLFCQRVNVYLDMLSTIMTEFVQRIEVDDRSEKKKSIPSKKLLVWWEEATAKDPSMEKSLWEGARGRDDVTQNEFRSYMNLPPDEDKNEAVLNKGSVQAVAGIAAQTTEGKLTPDQATAILSAMGLPEDVAKKIAGEGAPEPEEEDFGYGDYGEEEETDEEENQGESADQGLEEATEEMEGAMKGYLGVEEILKKAKLFVVEKA